MKTPVAMAVVVWLAVLSVQKVETTQEEVDWPTAGMFEMQLGPVECQPWC